MSIEASFGGEGGFGTFRKPDLSNRVVDDAEIALQIGRLMLESYINYYPDYSDYNSPDPLFKVTDKGVYWVVHSYYPHPTNEYGEQIGHIMGGDFMVTFRKSNCEIIDIGMG